MTPDGAFGSEHFSYRVISGGEVHIHQERRLYRHGELPGLLQLNQDQVDRLIRTGQLCPILICGETRFDSHEISTLIATYKQVAERKRQPYV